MLCFIYIYIYIEREREREREREIVVVVVVVIVSGAVFTKLCYHKFETKRGPELSCRNNKQGS